MIHGLDTGGDDSLDGRMRLDEKNKKNLGILPCTLVCF